MNHFIHEEDLAARSSLLTVRQVALTGWSSTLIVRCREIGMKDVVTRNRAAWGEKLNRISCGEKILAVMEEPYRNDCGGPLAAKRHRTNKHFKASMRALGNHEREGEKILDWSHVRSVSNHHHSIGGFYIASDGKKTVAARGGEQEGSRCRRADKHQTYSLFRKHPSCNEDPVATLTHGTKVNIVMMVSLTVMKLQLLWWTIDEGG